MLFVCLFVLISCRIATSDLLYDFSDYEYEYVFDLNNETNLEFYKTDCERTRINFYPERFHTYPDIVLDLAIQPRCLHRCLDVHRRFSYEGCKVSSECRDCLIPCLDDSILTEEDYFVDHDSEYALGQVANRCDKLCGHSVSCLDSCGFAVFNHNSRSQYECPSPKEVSLGGDEDRKVCVGSSECFSDVQCKRRTQKCCESITVARFCVDVFEEANATSLGYKSPDAFFINFKTNIIQDGSSFVVEYTIKPEDQAHLPKKRSVALYAWKSANNFTNEEEDFALKAFSTWSSSLAVVLDPGFLYQFKMGVYDANGLIGSKLDDLGHRRFEVEMPPNIDVIRKVQLELLSCSESFIDVFECSFAVNWTVETPLSYPVFYEVITTPCPRKASLFETVENRLDFRQRVVVCGRNIEVNVTAKAHVFSVQGYRSTIKAPTKTYTIRMHDAKVRCHIRSDRGGVQMREIQVRPQFGVVVDSSVRKSRMVLDDGDLKSLASSSNYDTLKVSAKALFCNCLSDRALEYLEYYSSIEEYQNLRLELRRNCAYSVSVIAIQSEDPSKCLSKWESVYITPDDRFAKPEVFPAANHVSKMFPQNVVYPIRFPGTLEMQFWSLNASHIVHTLEVDEAFFPVREVMFDVRCSEKIYMVSRYNPEGRSGNTGYPDCATYAYEFDTTSMCLKDSEYFILVSTRHLMDKSLSTVLSPLSLLLCVVTPVQFIVYLFRT